jgi:hypothetical protein
MAYLLEGAWLRCQNNQWGVRLGNMYLPWVVYIDDILVLASGPHDGSGDHQFGQS